MIGPLIEAKFRVIIPVVTNENRKAKSPIPMFRLELLAMAKPAFEPISVFLLLPKPSESPA